MNIFDVGVFFADAARLIPQLHTVEGACFPLLPLNDSLIEDVKSCLSYDEMVLLAADSGLAYDDSEGKSHRVVDNEKLAKKVHGLWAKDELKTDTDPCVRERVGEIVCNISGISEIINAQLKIETEKEDEEKIKVGDHSVPVAIDIADLDKDAEEYKIAV